MASTSRSSRCRTVEPALAPRVDGPLRVLVEGRPGVPFKGVDEALAAAGAMREPAHVTLVCADGAVVAGPVPAGADEVVGPLDAAGMATLYAKTDVVLKLSRVEGMAGPPLEGFHCGATCITTPVTGHDEYVSDGRNALLTSWDDERGTSRLLDLLARDRRLLHRLRVGALRTARSWPSTEQSTAMLALALRPDRRGALAGPDRLGGLDGRRHPDHDAAPSGRRARPRAAGGADAPDRVAALQGAAEDGAPCRGGAPLMGLGIKTKLKRMASGPVVNDEYVEARVLGALLRAPAGATLAPPADGAALHVAFVVPFFQQGSGGHMTIANLVRALERRGHRCSLWIDDPGRRCGGGPEGAARDLRAWFGPFEASVAYGLEAFAGADVAVATGWQTVARVRTLPAAGRAYLVQDHEPEFFGTSVQRAWARGQLPPRPLPDHRGPVAGRHDGRVVRVARHGL